MMRLETQEGKWRFGSGKMMEGGTYIFYFTRLSRPGLYIPNVIFSPNYRLNLAMPRGAELRVT
mgnify:CR=1 FL=1